MIHTLILAAALIDTNSITALQKPDSTYEKIEQWIDTSMDGRTGNDDYEYNVSKNYLRYQYVPHQCPVDPTAYMSPWAKGDVVYNDKIIKERIRIS